ncbi:Replication factor A protein 1 [Serendipita sp. 397]|nr:Replication factor A protein 1 [Serendipita sp. 397]
MDETGEIKATAFNAAVDLLYDRFQEGKCIDAGSVPEVKYTFIKLRDLGAHEKDSILDVLAVVHKVNDVAEIQTKQGKQLSKRDITLVDDSGHSCQCTLWGKQAEQWNHHNNPVVAFKGLKLSDFGGEDQYSRSSVYLTLA